MLGKVFQNIQQVGIRNQLSLSTGCRCVSSLNDIKNHGSRLCKSQEFVHEYSTSTNNDASEALQNKIKKGKNYDSVTTNKPSVVSDRLKTDDEADKPKSFICSEKPCLKENLNQNVTFQTHPEEEHQCVESMHEITTKNNNSTNVSPELIRQKSIDIFERGIHKLTSNLQKKQVIFEPSSFKLFRKRYLQTLERNINSKNDESDKVENLTKQENENDNVVKTGGCSNLNIKSLYTAKVTKSKKNIDEYSNVSDGNRTHLISLENKENEQIQSNISYMKIPPKIEFIINSPLHLKKSQYVQAFHPLNVQMFASDRIQNVTEDLQHGTGDINLKNSRIETIISKSYGTVQPSDSHNLRKNDFSHKLSLSTKISSDIEMRSSYSTSCEEPVKQESQRKSEKGCLRDLERRDARTQLPDRCLSKRNMSSIEKAIGTIPKGDPPSRQNMELLAKKKEKKEGKKKKKKPKKKSKKKPKKKKKVCAHDTSKISCLDVCHTRKPCVPKAKASKKRKPQKCLAIGCPRGLRGFCVKLKSIFKRDKKCSVKKGAKK